MEWLRSREFTFMQHEGRTNHKHRIIFKHRSDGVIFYASGGEEKLKETAPLMFERYITEATDVQAADEAVYHYEFLRQMGLHCGTEDEGRRFGEAQRVA